jgi:flagellar M-ring protein FliF
MDNVLPSPAALNADKNGGSAVFGRLAQLSTRNKLVLGAAAAMLAAIVTVGLMGSREPEYKVLFASLSDKDGGAIIAQLSQMNVPHKFSEGGGAILVPADKVHEARLKLASQGLPKGGSVGFELMENQKFGTTQFQERLNFQRGLEGELARSIMALGSVQSARVHLALPQQTAFLREQQKPSASVLLQLYGGRTLDRGQIAGIVHLVASSVPDLNPKSVSVVDQTGALLSQTGNDASPNGLDAPQLQYVRQTEQNLTSRILAILEPIVGAGNVKAQVTADVDFTQSESTAELYGPNQGNAPAAVRSQQLSEAPGNGLGANPAGVPGALSNQAPNTTPSPINGAPQNLSAGAGAPGGAAAGIKRDATTNYEVDKTVKVTRSATGNIRRLNAAVVVNHMAAAGEKGKPPAMKAIPAEQMAQINALVREAIGFNKDRGDSVNVVNAPFTVVADPEAKELPIWKQPETIELARSLAPWVAMPLVALIIIFGLVRPAMKAARAPAQKPRLIEATIADEVNLPGVTITGAAGGAPQLAGAAGQPGATDVPLLQTAQASAQSSRAAQLDAIRQLAKSNPATVANVVRNWAGQPAA